MTDKICVLYFPEFPETNDYTSPETAKAYLSSKKACKALAKHIWSVFDDDDYAKDLVKTSDIENMVILYNHKFGTKVSCFEIEKP